MKIYFNKKMKKNSNKNSKKLKQRNEKKGKKIHLELYREFDVSSSKLPPTHGKKGRKY
jgi:hypothetical protein